MPPVIATRPGPGFVGLQLALMSFASGCMDILSYRQLGQVFTSAMTGNAALLGLDLGQGNIPATSRNMAAFAAFLLGLILGSVLLRRIQGERGWSRSITRALAVEELLLVGFAVLWFASSTAPFPDPVLYALIILSAVAMGIQSATAHHIGVPGITTTYFTGTITNIVVNTVGRGLPARANKPAAAAQTRWPLFAFVAYVVGAALTGFLVGHGPSATLPSIPTWVAALPALAVAIVLLAAVADDKAGQRAAT